MLKAPPAPTRKPAISNIKFVGGSFCIKSSSHTHPKTNYKKRSLVLPFSNRHLAPQKCAPEGVQGARGFAPFKPPCNQHKNLVACKGAAKESRGK